MDPKLIVVLVIVALALLVLKALTNNKSTSNNDDIKVVSKENLLTEAENKFYKVLNSVLEGTEYVVFVQVNLQALIKMTSQNSSTFWIYRNWINETYIDFVICEKETTKVVVVIELDDSSHNTEKRKKRDEKLNSIFSKANINIIHMPVKNDYFENELKNLLFNEN